MKNTAMKSTAMKNTVMEKHIHEERIRNVFIEKHIKGSTCIPLYHSFSHQKNACKAETENQTEKSDSRNVGRRRFGGLGIKTL